MTRPIIFSFDEMLIEHLFDLKEKVLLAPNKLIRKKYCHRT